jgi:hypothetical protein
MLAGLLKALVVSSSNPSDIARKILPAIITLSGDLDKGTRLAAIRAFPVVLINVPPDLLLTKIGSAFDSILSVNPYSAESIEVLRTVGQVVPSLPQEFRDSYFLPRLVRLAVANSKDDAEDAMLFFGASPAAASTAERVIQKREKRTEMVGVLLSAFQSFSGCLLSAEMVGSSLILAAQMLARTPEQDIPVVL